MESSSSALVADVSPLLFEEEDFFFALPPGDFLGDFRGELPGDLFFLGEGDGEYRPSRGVLEDFFLGLDTGVEGGEL